MRSIVRRGLVVRLTFIGAGLLALGACGSRSHPAPVMEGDGSSGRSHPAPVTEGEGSSVPPGNAVYERSLNRWLDHPEEDLVATWGVPERSQRLTDGGQALEYRRADREGRLLCTTLFTSDVYGMVRNWTYRGSECRPPRLGDYGKAG
jgi:hypothetical protein